MLRDPVDLVRQEFSIVSKIVDIELFNDQMILGKMDKQQAMILADEADTVKKIKKNRCLATKL
jgi:hypothetical protein